MMPDQFQGAFYLISGFFLFTTMALSFRLISSSQSLNIKDDDSATDNDKWFGLEELEIIDVIQETHDIKTFRFKRKNKKKMPSFSPGQFLSFQIGNDDKLFRSYSIAGSCENRNLIQVSIKKIENGLGSAWFHSLAVGNCVQAYPPGGLFTDETLGDAPRVFIAGGIGITPFLSMITTAIERGQQHPITLFYGLRTVSDLAFHSFLSLLDKRFKNFSYFPVLSDYEGSNWDGLKGRITFDLIKPKINQIETSKYFFCGPPPMTEAITAELKSAGVIGKNIHSETFVSPTTISIDDIPERNLEISFKGRKYSYRGKQNLLDYFESQNVDIPFACRSGVCGACKVKCISGDAISLSDSGLTDEESKEHILTCVSWPETDLKLT